MLGGIASQPVIYLSLSSKRASNPLSIIKTPSFMDDPHTSCPHILFQIAGFLPSQFCSLSNVERISD